MKDVYIAGDTGSYHLILREWYFQGDGVKVERPRVRVLMDGAAA